eukprot:COSAG04_NODE_31067_length_259_cov_0.531250_1_plen_42_part_01
MAAAASYRWRGMGASADVVSLDWFAPPPPPQLPIVLLPLLES